VASRYWIKLYIELLDDPKMGLLPPELWRFAVELFLLAGETECNETLHGVLPNVTKIAWRLRYDVSQVENWLTQISRDTGIVTLTESGWVVTNFKKRQSAVETGDRVKQYRERKKQKNGNDETAKTVTKMKRNVTPESDTDTDTEIYSSSYEEEAKTLKSKKNLSGRPATIPAVKTFVEVTGKHVLNRTQMDTLALKVGTDPPALTKWKEVITAWMMRGYKITNIDGMLDWFEHGVPQRNGDYKNGPLPKNNEPSQPPPGVEPDAWANILAALGGGAG